MASNSTSHRTRAQRSRYPNCLAVRAGERGRYVALSDEHDPTY